MVKDKTMIDLSMSKSDGKNLVHTVLNPTYTTREIAQMSNEDFLSWLRSRNGYVLEDERRIVRARLNSLGMSTEFEKIDLLG